MKKELKTKAERRLKIIEGQVRGLQKMVADEKYCVDIITQVEAIKEALSSTANIILENHLATHVAHQIKHGQEKKAAEEMLKIYKLAQKK